MSVRTVNQISQIIRGVSYKPAQIKDVPTEGYIPIVKTNNIQNGKIIFNSLPYVESKIIKSSQHLKKGDVLVAASTGSKKVIGKAAMATDDWLGSFGAFCLVLRPDIKIINPDYFGYYFQSKNYRTAISHMSSGANINNLKKEYFDRLKLSVPTLDEQERVVEILRNADLLRQKRSEAILLLDKYLASKFVEMFGDLRLNPKKWEKFNLKDITLKITDGTHQSPKFLDSGIPFIFISNIIQNEITLNTKKFISELTYQELTKNTPIEKHDILYTTVGSYGNPALVKTDDKFCFQRHIAHIKPDRTKTNVYFLYGMLKTPFIKEQADEKARGVAQKTLNLGDLSKFQVILPPMEMQQRYADIVAEVERAKLLMLKQAAELDDQFHSILQTAFSAGE